MECNKEEALGAVKLAETKVQNKDFIGARKMAEKAQRLYPNLENILQLLTVCEVHCTAENKLGGSEMDWYRILMTTQCDDDDTIKKQYKRLALLLHPDKNRFAGAEAAFKLIVEANKVLSDHESRAKYDKKYRKALKKAGGTGNASAKRSQEGNATFDSETWVGMPADDGPLNTEQKNKGHGDRVRKHGLDSSRSSPRSGSSTYTNKKRGRSSSFKSGESSKRGKRATADSELNGDDHLGRASRSKQNCPFSENVNDNGDVVNPPGSLKKTRSASEKKMKNVARNGGIVEDDGKTVSEKKMNNAAMNGGIIKDDWKTDSGANSVIACIPKIIVVPDPEFNKFVLEENDLGSTFSANQTWALYDDVDGMPRFYVRINKVYTPGFKLKITWLVPNPDDKGESDWYKENLPVACGKFRDGLTEDITDHLMFSHQMHCTKGSGKGSFLVYPRKGETWAFYKNWDIGWSSDPSKHKPFHFNFVEILSDFSQDVGAKVANLTKVKGFVSLFNRAKPIWVNTFQVPPNELFRFSHRIPSFKMTGGERHGVPKGSWELDPASLSTD